MYFAIDPGNRESAYVLADSSLMPLEFGKEDNETVKDVIKTMSYEHFAIEMVASYGMAVGRDVFDTCVWIGRFCEVAIEKGIKPIKVYRKDVKMNLCHSMKAKDGNIMQALIDRFAYGARNHGKGTKDNPTQFYGFRADIWQAYAVCVTYHDLNIMKQEGCIQ